MTLSLEPRYLGQVAPRAGEDGVWAGEFTEFEKPRVMTYGGMMFTLGIMTILECFKIFSKIRSKHTIHTEANISCKVNNSCKKRLIFSTILIEFMLNVITVTLTSLAT